MIRIIALRLPLAITALMLAACNGEGSREDIGGVSASEAQALNDAADMLDNRAISTRVDEKAAR